jgi:A/G-specific adenine glycosylase
VTASTSLPISAADARHRRPSLLQEAILAWYRIAGRSLPFRVTRDPWAVLVSEVMAQQTQVSRVGPAWESFMIRFPTPLALASATPADIIRAWTGLGYNRRAVALQRAARLIVARHDGQVPDDPVALEALPGVGPYTARAVCAIAFGRAVGAVDVNVRRVLTRLASTTADPLPASRLRALADELVPIEGPADWTHALMDLGATVCRPTEPRCHSCPARPFCRFGLAARATARARRARPGSSRVPFERTNRWLRGRIVQRLAMTPDTEWRVVDGPIGSHDVETVRRVLGELAAEGLIELAADRRRVRLPSAAPDG